MTRNLTAAITAAMLVSLPIVSAVFAEESGPSAQPPHSQGMMRGPGDMMNMTGQMDPEHAKQMGRMMDNCNRMMESADRSPIDMENQPAPNTQG